MSAALLVAAGLDEKSFATMAARFCLRGIALSLIESDAGLPEFVCVRDAETHQFGSLSGAVAMLRDLESAAEHREAVRRMVEKGGWNAPPS